MAVIGNAPFQGLVSGGEILDASIEGVDLSTSAIAARLGYTPVDPGAAVFSANPTISSGTANGVAYLSGSKVVTTGSGLTFDGTTLVAANISDSSLTSGRVVYAGTGGNLTDSANLLFSGQTLSITNSGALVNGTSALNVSGGSNLAISASSIGEAYAANTQSTKYEYYQAGTIVSLSASSENVNTGALIDINAYNSAGGATGVFLGAVAGSTGNGPANFIIGRRTSTTGWAESLRINTSGNVGIGTDSPTESLTVSGRVMTVGSGYTVNPGGGIFGYYNGAGVPTAYLQMPASGRIQFWSPGTGDLATLDSSGRLTVGTTSPGSSGSAKFTVTGNSVVFNPNTDGKDTHVFTTGAVDEGTYAIKADTVTKVYLHSNGSSYLNGGSVGIGLTAPTQKLHVNASYGINSSSPAASGTTQNGILRLTPNAGTFGETLDFGMNIGPTYAWIQSTNWSGLGTNYSLVLNPNGGNVGVGTTNPQSKLHVAGGINDSMSLVAGASADGAIAYTTSELRECAFNVTSGSNFRISNIVTSATGWRAVFRGTWSNNYEGGGLTPPAPYIEVNAANNSFLVGSRTLAVSRDANGYLVVNCTDGHRISFSGSIEIYENPQSGQPANSIVTIGKVGVGLRNPNYPLEVAGGVASRGVGFILRNDAGSSNTGIFSPYNIIAGSGTDYSSTIFSETGLGIYFCVNGSATRSAILNSSGNFGLGTTDINYKITNSGHLAFTTGSSNTDGAADAQRNGIGWQATGASTVLGSFITANNQGNWGSDLQFFTRGASGGVLGERLRIASTGNVHIGNASDPGYRLGIYSNTDNDGIMVDVLNSPTIILRDRGNSDTRIGTGGTAGLDNFYVSTYSTNHALMIKGSNGFVGIGTNDPGERLTVAGAIRTTSNATNFSGQTGAVFDYYGGAARFAAHDGTNTGTMYFNASRNGLSIGTTVPSPANGLRVSGATNPAGGIVSTNLIMGYVASNYSGTRYWLLHQMQTGAGVEQSAFNCMGDIHASSYTTWNLCNLWIRREYASTSVYAGITGVIKSSVTVSVVDITYNNVRYIAIKFAGGDPGIEANLVGYLMDQMYTNGTDANFINGTTGVTENAVIASY